ncbi:NCS2 family permease [Escherichia albertii]|uniref:NCS2 family permease n=1 Tax=Escherichia albertii TaxID=208962 RepID=UPI002D77392A|nr:NCS2 family permease [Escherichia albertii]WRT54587.1 NCS2 family permease [Escherichia albertii]
MNNDNTDYVSNESGTLSRLFKLPQHGTTVRTELIAGMTTFLTMVYIVFVNPQILGAAQMDPKVVFVTTCLIAGIGSIAMGLNAFFAFVVVGAMGISWQTGMGAIFWGAIGLFLLTLFRIRYWMISNIPLSLRIGITSGIGLFIALMGLNLQSKCNKKRSTHQLEYNFVSTQKPFPNDEYFLPTSYNKRARKDNDFTRTGQKTSRNCQSTGT